MFTKTSHMRQFTALLLSIGLLLIGNGLQNTLIGIRAQIEGFPTTITGIVVSAYFIGFVMGGFVIPRLVETVGHIRVFIACASLASAGALIHILIIDPWAWFFIRIITGLSLMGLFLVTESWLNGRTSNTNRGFVFSIYIVVTLGALAIGNQMLLTADPAGPNLFIFSSMLFSVAVLPIAFTKAIAPSPLPAGKLKLRRFFKKSPMGISAAFTSGLCGGAFWGMAPVYAYSIGMKDVEIAFFMTLTIAGGVVLQAPIGYLSDRIDRRKIIVLVTLLLSLVTAVLYYQGPDNYMLFLILAFLMGGMMFSIYSLGTAHLNDRIDEIDLIHASSALLLTSGAGSIIGPIASSVMMQYLGVSWFFGFMAVVTLLMAIYSLYRITQRNAEEDQQPFVSMPITTRYVAQLDPRVDDDEEAVPSK